MASSHKLLLESSHFVICISLRIAIEGGKHPREAELTTVGARFCEHGPIAQLDYDSLPDISVPRT